MNIANDWKFFREHQDRCYHARLASPAELDRLRTHADLDNLAPGTFVYCLARLDRAAAQLQQLFVVLEPMEDEEAFAMAAWFDADSRLLAAHVQERVQ